MDADIWEFYDFTCHMFVPFTCCCHMGHSSELLTIHLFRNFSKCVFMKLSQFVSYCLCDVFRVSRPVIFSTLNGPICVQPQILLWKSIAVQICSTIVWRHIYLFILCSPVNLLEVCTYTFTHCFITGFRVPKCFFFFLVSVQLND